MGLSALVSGSIGFFTSFTALNITGLATELAPREVMLVTGICTIGSGTLGAITSAIIDILCCKKRSSYTDV